MTHPFDISKIYAVDRFFSGTWIYGGRETWIANQVQMLGEPERNIVLEDPISLIKDLLRYCSGQRIHASKIMRQDPQDGEFKLVGVTYYFDDRRFHTRLTRGRWNSWLHVVGCYTSSGAVLCRSCVCTELTDHDGLISDPIVKILADDEFPAPLACQICGNDIGITVSADYWHDRLLDLLRDLNLEEPEKIELINPDDLNQKYPGSIFLIHTSMYDSSGSCVLARDEKDALEIIGAYADDNWPGLIMDMEDALDEDVPIYWVNGAVPLNISEFRIEKIGDITRFDQE